jgi:hypothetical protein
MYCTCQQVLLQLQQALWAVLQHQLLQRLPLQLGSANHASGGATPSSAAAAAAAAAAGLSCCTYQAPQQVASPALLAIA